MENSCASGEFAAVTGSPTASPRGKRASPRSAPSHPGPRTARQHRFGPSRLGLLCWSLEHRVVATLGGQAHLNDAGRPAEGYPEQAGRFAGENLAASVALKLEVPADTQLTADWHEPSLDAVWLGQGVPDIADWRVVAALQ
jgi:hypothetical protein